MVNPAGIDQGDLADKHPHHLPSFCVEYRSGYQSPLSPIGLTFPTSHDTHSNEAAGSLSIGLLAILCLPGSHFIVSSIRDGGLALTPCSMVVALGGLESWDRF
jgi:hypothetical protein